MSIRCFDEITSKVEEEEEEKNKPAMIEISLSSVQNTRQSTDANIHVFFCVQNISSSRKRVLFTFLFLSQGYDNYF